MLKQLLLTPKTRLWVVLLTLAGTTLGTLLTERSLRTDCYTAEAELYPAIMQRGCADTAAVNPCYKISCITQSDGFRRRLCGEVEAIDPDCYDRDIRCYESARHTMVLEATLPDSNAALRAVRSMLDGIESMFWQYTTAQIELGSDFSETVVKDFHWDTVARLLPETEAKIYCFNTVDEPHLTACPQPRHWMLSLLLSFVFSLAFSYTIVYLVLKLK